MGFWRDVNRAERAAYRALATANDVKAAASGRPSRIARRAARRAYGRAAGRLAARLFR